MTVDSQVQELTSAELDEVAGGPVPLVLVAAAGLSHGGLLMAIGISLYERYN